MVLARSDSRQEIDESIGPIFVGLVRIFRQEVTVPDGFPALNILEGLGLEDLLN